MDKTQRIIDEIQDAYREPPAERAARILFVFGIREEDIATKFVPIVKVVGEIKLISVRNALRDLERGFKKRK